MTWREYTIFLLESIGIYNSDLMLHYYRKIKKFANWYKKRDNIDIYDIPDEADLKLKRKLFLGEELQGLLKKMTFI